MNEQLFIGGVGVGLEEVVTPPSTPPTSPWLLAFAMSTMSAATGFLVEEIKKKRKRRRR